MNMMRFCMVLAMVMMLFAAASVLHADNWIWELSDSAYKQLNIFERAQYDKAADLFRQGNYKSAASEFEKFKIQFPDSTALSYVLFMRGLSLHRGKYRNEAIKIYNEVLDYFGDHIEDASAALYHMGIAHIENGDIRKGMEAMKEMADDEDYRNHPLAAGAIRRLGDNYFKNKEYELAIKYWKQVVRNFQQSNDYETNIARSNVLGYYIRNRNCAAIDNWMVNAENRNNTAYRRSVADKIYDVAWSGFLYGWGKYTEFNRKVKVEDMNAFYLYFLKQKAWYLKEKAPWDFYYRAIQFCAKRTGNKKELARLLDETGQYISKLKKNNERDNKYSWIVDRLRESRHFERARYCIAKISDPALACFKEYELLGTGQNKWHNAAKKLIEITQMGNADWQKKAEDTLAWVYKDRTGEYEKAIKLYLQINRPPSTLWGIQECYKRMRKLKEALQTLTEIESMFPKEAPRAAWHKAAYCKEAGDRKKAISHARRILKVYKESPEASLAHQMLEGFGVETGGGVVDQE